MELKISPKYKVLGDSLITMIKKYINNNDTVLDLGCGICNPIKEIKCKHITGVDIFEGYKPIAEKIVDKFILEDITKLKINLKSYDVVMALDVLEHLEYEEAIKLITKMEVWANKRVLIFTTIGFVPQKLDDNGLDAWGYKNKAQLHKCGFTVEEMMNRGYTCYQGFGDSVHGINFKTMFCYKDIKKVNI